METRLIAQNDAPVLAALHAESFGSARWNQDQIAASLALDTVRGWMIDDAGQPLGFILSQATSDEAEILTFCVAPAARRRGIGAALLAALLSHARAHKMRRLFLEVAVDNQAALALYAKNNFRMTGKRPGYYHRDGQAVDAVLLTLDLP